MKFKLFPLGIHYLIKKVVIEFAKPRKSMVNKQTMIGSEIKSVGMADKVKRQYAMSNGVLAFGY